MTTFVFVLIAISVFVLGLGGIMYIDHRYALTVAGRSYSIKGRKIDTDDPYVRRQFKKYYAIRVAYSVALLVVLVVVVNNVG